MSVSVSPYLSQALAQSGAQSGAASNTQASSAPDSNPQIPATPSDSVTLSPQALNTLNKTLIETAMERILDGVKNSSGPKLVFQPAVGTKLDQSC